MSEKINKPTVLIAPLDWGLGHATRCIPLIKALLVKDCAIIIATDGAQQILLKQEFPQLQFIKLKGYQVKYGKTGWALPLNIIGQIPKILISIWKEHRWLNKISKQYSIDAVISDNRYGLYHSNIRTVFITHQLTIKTQFVWLEKILQRINYGFINRFNQCWIPDYGNEINIAGDLSHPALMPAIPTSYLGALGRFDKNTTTTIKYDYCFLLSGPEPQRTILEELIMKDLHSLNKKIIIVRGTPNNYKVISLNEWIEIKNHLSQKELGKVIQESEYIICRSGYSSLMEILSLSKKSILIPTPGQTEQIYLAKKMHQQQWCFSVEQKNFSLLKTLQEAQHFKFQLPSLNKTNLPYFIHQFIATLSSK